MAASRVDVLVGSILVLFQHSVEDKRRARQFHGVQPHQGKVLKHSPDMGVTQQFHCEIHLVYLERVKNQCLQFNVSFLVHGVVKIQFEPQIRHLRFTGANAMLNATGEVIGFTHVLCVMSVTRRPDHPSVDCRAAILFLHVRRYRSRI